MDKIASMVWTKFVRSLRTKLLININAQERYQSGNKIVPGPVTKLSSVILCESLSCPLVSYSPLPTHFTIYNTIFFICLNFYYKVMVKQTLMCE